MGLFNFLSFGIRKTNKNIIEEDFKISDYQLFIQAIQQSDLDTVQYYLDKGIDFNYIYSFQKKEVFHLPQKTKKYESDMYSWEYTSPVLEAAKLNSSIGNQIIKKLIIKKSGEKIGAINNEYFGGWPIIRFFNPLLIAIENKNSELLQIILTIDKIDELSISEKIKTKIDNYDVGNSLIGRSGISYNLRVLSNHNSTLLESLMERESWSEGKEISRQKYQEKIKKLKEELSPPKNQTIIEKIKELKIYTSHPKIKEELDKMIVGISEITSMDLLINYQHLIERDVQKLVIGYEKTKNDLLVLEGIQVINNSINEEIAKTKVDYTKEMKLINQKIKKVLKN